MRNPTHPPPRSAHPSHQFRVAPDRGVTLELRTVEWANPSHVHRIHALLTPVWSPVVPQGPDASMRVVCQTLDAYMSSGVIVFEHGKFYCLVAPAEVDAACKAAYS